MAGKVTAHVDGLRELGEKMRGLSEKVNKRIANSVSGGAARVIRKRMIAKIKSNPSINTGSLLGSVIVKKIPKGQSKLTSEHIATFRGRGKPYNKKGQKIDRAPHAHLIEFGTVNMPAEPVMRPAYDQGKGEALQVMETVLARGIAKASK